MARIDWTPLAIPTIGESALRAQQIAGSTIQNAFTGLSGVVDQWEGARRDDNLEQLFARQNAYAGMDPATYEAAIRSGELTAGLNYLKPSDLVNTRAFAGELRSNRNSDASFRQGEQRFANDMTEFQWRSDDRTETKEQKALMSSAYNDLLPALAQARVSNDPTAIDAVMAGLRAKYPTLSADNLMRLMDSGTSALNEGRSRQSHDLSMRQGEQGLYQSAYTFQDNIDTKQEGKNVQALLSTVMGLAGANIDDKTPGGGAERALSNAIQSGNYTPREISLVAAQLGVAAPPDVLAALQGEDGGSSNRSFSDRMGMAENSGRWTGVNAYGYGGRIQMGQARLIDAANAGVVPRGMTPAQYAQLPPEKQREVEEWHWNDIDKQAERRGLGRFSGQVIGGVPINRDSIRAMAQLGGIGGAERFIRSDGQYNPKDRNGTSLRDYGRRFGDGPTAQERWGPRAQQNQTAVGGKIPSSPSDPGSFITDAESVLNNAQNVLANQGGAIGLKAASEYSTTQGIRDNADVIARLVTTKRQAFEGVPIDAGKMAAAISQLQREVGGSLTAASAANIISGSRAYGGGFRNAAGQVMGNVRDLGGGVYVDMVQAAQIGRSLQGQGGSALSQTAANVTRGTAQAQTLLTQYTDALNRYKNGAAADERRYGPGRISDATRGYAERLMALETQITALTNTTTASAHSFAGTTPRLSPGGRYAAPATAPAPGLNGGAPAPMPTPNQMAQSREQGKAMINGLLVANPIAAGVGRWLFDRRIRTGG